MDKNRDVGSAKQVRGAVKQAIARIEGKIPIAIGGLKDAVKDAPKGGWALRLEAPSSSVLRSRPQPRREMTCVRRVH